MPKLPWHEYVGGVRVTKALPALLAEVAEVGWRVNNLFQLPDGMWRSNLRSGDETKGQLFHEYADGKSAEEALTAAIWNMRQKRGVTAIPTLAMKANEAARRDLQRQMELLRDAMK